jgi:tRNA 2-thiocytidine biosynthesis protein TtcA
MPTTESSFGRQLEGCSGRLLGKLRRTARRWPVLPEGESVMLAVSGGIDSLAMAYLVGEHNRRLQRPLEISAVHVCLDADGPAEKLPDSTVHWLASRDLEVIEVEGRLDGSDETPLDCFTCARIRRRTLLETASARGASRVALGHHADDVVETWLLSLMYTGNAESIPPVRSYFGGAVTIVRPLYELQRRELVRLGQLAGFPEPVARCRREDRARRERVRQALSALGRDQSLVRRQLYWAAVRRYEEVERSLNSGADAGQLAERSKGG